VPIYVYKCATANCTEHEVEIETLESVTHHLKEMNVICHNCKEPMKRVIGRISVVTEQTRWNAVCNVPRSKHFNENPLECPNG